MVEWFGAQLNCRWEKANDAKSLRFLDADGRKIDIALREQDGHPIGKVVLNSGGVEFAVSPAQCADLLEVSRRGRNEKPIPQMMPAQDNNPVSLLSQELLRGGPHRVYLRAVNCVREVL